MSNSSRKVADLVKPVVIQTITNQAFGALISLTGFGWIFGLPIVRNVSRFIIERIATWAVNETAAGFSVLWIQVDVSYEIENAEKAAARLKEMLDTPAKYSEAEQKEIDAYFDETTIELIQLGIKRL